MPRRVVRDHPSLFAPAGTLLTRLAQSDNRARWRFTKFALLILGALFIWSLLSGAYSITNIIRLTLDRDRLARNNREQLTTLIDSRRIRDLLTNNPGYIEYVARTRYHMVIPNEVVYRYRKH